jgi:hypothetical protein
MATQQPAITQSGRPDGPHRIDLLNHSGWPGGATGRCGSEENHGRPSPASHVNALDSCLGIAGLAWAGTQS